MKKAHITTVLAQLGQLFYLLAFLLILPLLSLIWYPEEYAESIFFIIPAIACLLIGFSMSKLFSNNTKDRTKLTKSEQVSIVVLAWLISCFVCCIPFIVSGNLNFTQAFFEASSGLSTTGLSVINVEEIEKIYLLFRSMMQLYGGVGIILILVTIFNSSIGFELFQTEGHGEALIPSMKNSVKAILLIYLGLIGSGTIALTLAGMPSFDALNIAICAVSTGGFAVTSMSIADYHSSLINYIVIVLMIFGSFSFFANLLICTGQFKKFIKIDEVRLFFKIIIIFTLLGAFFTLAGEYNSEFGPIEIALFEIVSAITTTGFSLISYSEIIEYNQMLYLLVVFSMLIGGAIGSTSGGIKITRITMFFSSLKWNIKKLYTQDNKLIPRTINMPSGKKRISDRDLVMASNYVFLYLLVIVIGTTIFVASGYDIASSLFEVSSALAGAGLTSGITSPDLPPYLLWTLSIIMFIGRLEIFIVIVFMIKLSTRILRIPSTRKLKKQKEAVNKLMHK